MNKKTDRSVHWSFWAIGVVALLWNVMGGINFFMQMNADMVASFPDTHRAIIDGRPVWATAGFAVAVFGGAIGCIFLLLTKSTAFYVFIASLLGVIVTMIHTINITTTTIDFSIFELVMMILMPLVVAALLVWFSKQAQRKNWIS